MVETEGTLEQNIKIVRKMPNFTLNQQSGFILFGSGDKCGNNDNCSGYESGNENISRKLLITNLSKFDKIAVLLENEDSSDDRRNVV